MKFDTLLYGTLRVLARILTLLVCRCQMSGREHIPSTGPLLIVANHLSWYDPLLLGALLTRRVWFFAKEEIFRWPIVGWLALQTGQVSVSRGRSDRVALEKALAYLREGKALVIFPEGTVERQEQMIAAHTGVALLALRSHAMVLPIAHSGTRRILRSRWEWFPRVTVQIGTSYVPMVPEGVGHKEALQAITSDVMVRIAHMLPPEQRGIYRK